MGPRLAGDAIYQPSGRLGPVQTSTGFTPGLSEGLRALGHADTIVVPGYENYRQPRRIAPSRR
jgi:hypothetical protein